MFTHHWHDDRMLFIDRHRLLISSSQTLAIMVDRIPSEVKYLQSVRVQRKANLRFDDDGIGLERTPRRETSSVLLFEFDVDD